MPSPSATLPLTPIVTPNLTPILTPTLTLTPTVILTRCLATQQALLAILMAAAARAGSGSCGCKDRIQVNLAPSDEPDALPSLIVNIVEASPHATADELAKLARLHKDGVLTDAEFAAAKQKVLLTLTLTLTQTLTLTLTLTLTPSQARHLHAVRA